MEVEDQAQMHTAAECEMESESEAKQSSDKPLSPTTSVSADHNSRVQVAEPAFSAQNVAFDKKVKPRYMREDTNHNCRNPIFQAVSRCRSCPHWS